MLNKTTLLFSMIATILLTSCNPSVINENDAKFLAACAGQPRWVASELYDYVIATYEASIREDGDDEEQECHHHDERNLLHGDLLSSESEVCEVEQGGRQEVEQGLNGPEEQKRFVFLFHGRMGNFQEKRRISFQPFLLFRDIY